MREHAMRQMASIMTSSCQGVIESIDMALVAANFFPSAARVRNLARDSSRATVHP